MYKGKKILAVIPARGRNDEISHMNMRILGKKPLLYYTFRAAKNNKYIDELIVSTEDKHIANYAKEQGIKVPYLRDEKLSKDNVDMSDILRESINYYKNQNEDFDYILALYPNSPFKTAELIDEFIEKIEKSDYDVIIPVYGNKGFFWQEKNDRFELIIDKERHSRKDTITKYEERGGIYAYREDSLTNKRDEDFKIGFNELDYHHSRMINTLYDLYLLDRLIKLPSKLLKDMQMFK
jgi:CMP-N-acetylneuraminic acid synthetase